MRAASRAPSAHPRSSTETPQYNSAAACTPSGSRLVLTHAIPGYRKMVSFLARLIGEPWESAVPSEDLPAYVAGTGWEIVSEPDTDSAHGVERYAVAERR